MSGAVQPDPHAKRAETPRAEEGLGDESPFDRYDIDPGAGPQAITERFRELVAEAPESERDALRAAWDDLTLHPEGRVRAAFFAHPETRPPLGDPPRRRRSPAAAEAAPRPTMLGLLVLPSLAALSPRRAATEPGDALDNDPVLAEK